MTSDVPLGDGLTGVSLQMEYSHGRWRRPTRYICCSPTAAMWTPTAPGPVALYSAVATLLSDGRVPRRDVQRAKSYTQCRDLRPRTDMVDDGSHVDMRTGHTATLLKNGKVLVAGGYLYPNYFTSAESDDP